MNSKPLRMRSAAAAYNEILNNDPETCVSERQIRNLMKSGTIPVIDSGHGLQVNMDILYEYFTDPTKFL